MAARVIQAQDIQTAHGFAVTLTGPFTLAGSYSLSFTVTGPTTLTLPQSGQLLAGPTPVNQVLVGGGTGVVGALSNGAAGTVLTSNGANAAPTFQTPPAAPVQSVVGQTGAVTTAQVTTAVIGALPAALPTAEPTSPGILWNNNGVLSVS
jgi:hypothetical protein